MRRSKRRRDISRIDVVGLPRVAVYGSLTAQPAYLRGIPDFFCSLGVTAGVEFALGLVTLGVLYSLML
jgi:hypothetical protein